MRKGHRKGFLLVEVLISIFILIMVAATGVSLVVYGYRAINFNGNSIEASWLAQECANTLRGLRDTNWIRFGYDKKGCWNMAGTDNCNPGNAISEGSYILQIPINGNDGVQTPPSLESVEHELNLENGINESDEQFRLYYHTLEENGDETSPGRQFLSHDDAGSIGESKFFRILQVISATPTEIDATCTVAWFEVSKVEKIELPATVTNYITD